MTAINLPISCAEVYWCISDSEPVNSQEIAQKIGLAKSTVQGHLSALEKTSAIKGQGRPKQYCISNNIPSETLQWLKEFEELARMTRGLRGKRLLPLGQVCVEGLMLEVSEPLHLICATTVLQEIAKVSLEVVGKGPLGEDYKGFLLLPALSEHGWRCDFSMPDGSFRQGSASHNFPAQTKAWAREMIDTGRVNSMQTKPRQFIDEPIDEPLVVRPFLSLLDSAFGQYFSQSGDRRSWLLAAYLMLKFGNQGQTSFWDDFLADTVRIKPRQLTKYLNELSELGILRYFRPPNRNCPTKYYLGPAWLSVQQVSLIEAELEAIEDGEMHREDGYLWGIPFGERNCQGGRILQQEGNAIVRVPKEPGEPFWYSTWDSGEWTHRKKASPDSQLEPPVEKRITAAELQTAFQQLATRELYNGHFLIPMPYSVGNKLAWSCGIDLANGKRLHGDQSKSFKTVGEALTWAKKTIDEADDPLFLKGQALAPQLDAVPSYLMLNADAMLQKYLPQATDSHVPVLKYLLKQFQNQGTDTFWDYFLALGFALTSRKFLSISRDLAKSGLIRCSRYTAAHMMDFYLGPAWLSLEGVVLTEQELQAIALGEQVASYHPWRKSDESYPGEKYGFPCMERTERNIGYFHQGLGMSAKWILRQEGNILVRVPVNPHYPTWYSTWQDGFWTHNSSDFVKEDNPEDCEWFGWGVAKLGLSTVVANSDFL